MRITKVFAMPSRWTFTIKPISQLLNKYVGDGEGWIDPFAGDNSPAENTNDLNPKSKSKTNMHALNFVKMIPGSFKGVLFDPPYSPRQIKECYNGIGLSSSGKDTQGFSNVKREVSKKIIHNGLAICFGWNSNGFGKVLGFEMIEILIVSHGGNHNDTIVTVERKFLNDYAS